MSQQLSEIKYYPKHVNGQTYYFADTENPTFRCMLWETEDMCRLGTALFVTSNCTIREFTEMIGATFRMWGIKSEWSILNKDFE